MQVLDITEIKLERSDITNLHVHTHDGVYEVPNGTVGVGTIIRDIAVRRRMFTNEDEQDEFPLRMFDGMGWEMICAQLYPQCLWQPGAFEKDGVSGHPDGISPMHTVGAYDGTWVIEEWKRTGKSLRVKGGKEDQYKDIRGEWLWMQQVMGYCNLVSSHMGVPVRHARLHINWSCGAYTYPLTPRYMRYVVEFEAAELRGNWAMLKTELR